MAGGRRPDYRVGALLRSSQGKSADFKNNAVGVAWANDDGSISVKFDPFIVIHGGPDVLVTLFPNEEDSSNRKHKSDYNQDSTDSKPF